ncbi:MAG: tRNA (adenosine(37)-N6)-threonylcarbamoyltransferase complex transferase subunit TsaD, partial [Patescibacteria group bacterium]
MIILGIESSCDETSVALVEASDDGFVVLAEKTQSQIDVHKKYGGVVPEIAGRQHAENVMPIVESVIGDWRLEIGDAKTVPDVIAVTAGPGLVTGLVVGVEAAKALSYLWDVPLVAVNHIEGHIHSVQIQNPKSKIQNPIQFPAVCLIVSGGHTELLLMRDHGVYELIGKTRDDAAGECFDKVGKLIGIDYPAGPTISKLAETGSPVAIPFPRPMLDSDNFEFSFAGLKTATLYWLRDHALSP